MLIPTTLTCPVGGNDLELSGARPAEPDTNSPAFRGGTSCGACGFVDEVEPKEVYENGN